MRSSRSLRTVQRIRFQSSVRNRNGLKHVSAENLIPAPDCGMKYLPRDVAFGKLKAMADGAAIVRAELTGA